MALKRSYDRQEDIPEQYRADYSEKDGKWVVEVEGMVEKEKLEEFRTNNITLDRRAKELETQLANYTGLDPAEYKRMKGELDAIQNKKMLEAGEVDKLAEKLAQERLAPVKEELSATQAKLKKSEEVQASTFAKLSRFVVDDALRTVALDLKVRKEAIPDLILRGRDLWQYKDDKIVAMDGDRPRLNKDGTGPLDMVDWGRAVIGIAPHLLEPSQGAGGAGGTGGAGSTPVTTIPATDPVAFGNNLEAIAKGTVTTQAAPQ